VVAKGVPRVVPEVVTAGAEKVTLRDCADGTNRLQHKMSAGLKNDVPGAHWAAEATVVLQGGERKVSDLYPHESGSC
jgi:hypothetical protein